MKILIAFVIVYVIYSLQLYLYRKYWKTGLDVDLQFSGDIVLLGEKVELIEVIRNKKPLALPILNVKFATSRSFTFDEEDNATSKTRKTIMDKLSYFTDGAIEGEILEDDKALYILSYRTIIDALNMVLQKDKEKREGGDSNLIKVIEYT